MRYNPVRINVVARLARVTNQNIALARRQRVQATHSNPMVTCVVQQHLLVINKKLALDQVQLVLQMLLHQLVLFVEQQQVIVMWPRRATVSVAIVLPTRSNHSGRCVQAVPRSPVTIAMNSSFVPVHHQTVQQVTK